MEDIYKSSARYWANVPATVDGVLGGFGHISDIDINGSKAFLEKVFALENPPGTKLALDCGAGIGRISKHLLMPQFDKVDLLEQDEKFINTAKQCIGDNPKLGVLYLESLQTFEFKNGKLYDVIWCQWVLCYLNDCDFINFLKKCKVSLQKNGAIVIKENISMSDEMDFDEDDSSVARPLQHMITLFRSAQLQVVLTDIQKDFPEELYPVHTFLLTPLKLT